jgi:hypothetical protein
LAHHCPAAVVTCEDFRLHRRADGRDCIGEFIAGLGVDCDLISGAGGIQDLVRPKSGFDDALMRDLTVSVELHEVKRIHLVNHEDCGAYASLNLRSREVEREQHRSDLLEARAMLEARFPGVAVSLYLASLRLGTADHYEIRPIE